MASVSVSTPSPSGKRKSEDASELTPYAAKLPKFDSAGDYMSAEQAKHDHANLQAIITGCQQRPGLIRVLFGKLTEAQRQGAKGALLDPILVLRASRPQPAELARRLHVRLVGEAYGPHEGRAHLHPSERPEGSTEAADRQGPASRRFAARRRVAEHRVARAPLGQAARAVLCFKLHRLLESRQPANQLH